jgi:ABC-2 type transport system permease protein
MNNQRTMPGGRRFRWLVHAEAIKAATLPHIAVVIVVAIIGGPLLTLAFTAATPAAPATPTPPAAIGLQTVLYLQIAFVLLGVLHSACEYQGGQIATTLAAMPDRTRLMIAKTVVFLVTAVVTATTTVVGSVAVAIIRNSNAPSAWNGLSHHAGHIAGAIAYLLLIGTIGFSTGIIARDVLGASTAMLTFLAIATLLRNATRLAFVLPSNAGISMYTSTPPNTGQPTALASTAIVATWAITSWSVALHQFHRRDI